MSKKKLGIRACVRDKVSGRSKIEHCRLLFGSSVRLNLHRHSEPTNKNHKYGGYWLMRKTRPWSTL